MKKTKRALILLFVIGNIIFSFVMSGNNNRMYSVNLTDIVKMAEAHSEPVQFCTRNYSPLWGICYFVGNGYDCIYIAPDCALCDCDGTYIKDI